MVGAGAGAGVVSLDREVNSEKLLANLLRTLTSEGFSGADVVGLLGAN